MSRRFNIAIQRAHNRNLQEIEEHCTSPEGLTQDGLMLRELASAASEVSRTAVEYWNLCRGIGDPMQFLYMSAFLSEGR